MALIDRQVRDRIVSRGLGGPSSGLDKEKSNFSLEKNIRAFVYLEKLYYPTTGTVSTEEDISGWHWDRTEAQEILRNSFRFEIKDHIGGYGYNLLEGTSIEDYRGSVESGCELISVSEGYRKRAKDFDPNIKELRTSTEWHPTLATGVYSVQGKEKPLFSSSSINKCFINANGISSNSVDLSNYNIVGNLDNVLIATYKRDKNFIKSIFREYKEDAYLYKYEVDSNYTYTINSNLIHEVGGGIITTSQASDVEISRLEEIGIYSSGNNINSFYTSYFPISNVQVVLEEDVLDSNDYSIDHDLGIISINTSDPGTVRVRYHAVPRIDFEIKPEIGFKGKVDLKSHRYKQSNGIIEISTEEKHVSRISLSRVREDALNPLYYGEDSLGIEALVLDSRDNVVDEIKVTFKCLDTNQEIRFEGNLLEISSESNFDGLAFTRINAPLSDEASSYYFNDYPNGGFTIPMDEINVGANFAEDSLIFEVLACDPFYGSKGITLDVTNLQEDPNEGWYFEIDTNLDSQDYKLFRNALNKSFVNPVDGVDCFESFYNSGFVKYNGNLFLSGYKTLIKKITKDKIYLHGIPAINTFSSITIFQKNSNYNLSSESKGVERVLYKKESDDTLKLLRVQATEDGLVNLPAIENRQHTNLVVGYRLYVPRKTRIQASCIDPATGIEIFSNEIAINVKLSDIYKSEINFKDDNDRTLATALNTMNFISYDAVDNNFYFEGVTS